MVEALLYIMEQYKAAKTHKGTDFEADVITFYSSLREIMASLFPVTDFSLVQVTCKDYQRKSCRNIRGKVKLKKSK